VNQSRSLSTSRRRALYAGAAALAGLLGAGLAWWRYAPAPVDEDAALAVWTLEFETLSAQKLAMKSLRGRPLLINFWATWCPPCVEELPLLDAFYRENSSTGWQVLGLAVDRPDPVRSFLARQPLGFPVALAGVQGIALSQSLGNLAGGLPFSVLFSATGSILDRKIGKLSSHDLARWRALS
jgi:thiol-disulfide isomerase/thioredoxin